MHVWNLEAQARTSDERQLRVIISVAKYVLHRYTSLVVNTSRHGYKLLPDLSQYQGCEFDQYQYPE